MEPDWRRIRAFEVPFPLPHACGFLDVSDVTLPVVRSYIPNHGYSHPDKHASQVKGCIRQPFNGTTFSMQGLCWLPQFTPTWPKIFELDETLPLPKTMMWRKNGIGKGSRMLPTLTMGYLKMGWNFQKSDGMLGFEFISEHFIGKRERGWCIFVNHNCKFASGVIRSMFFSRLRSLLFQHLRFFCIVITSIYSDSRWFSMSSFRDTSTNRARNTQFLALDGPLRHSPAL